MEEIKEKEIFKMLRMKTQKNRNKGFTLVELVIVVAIIAVLSVVAVVAYSNISGQAKEAAIASDASVVVRALNTYNALAPERITDTASTTAPITKKLEATTTGVALLKDLKLTKTAGGIDMNLGVSLTLARLGDVMLKIEYDKVTTTGGVTTGSDMWILKP